ncbi:ORC ubiquitin ligase 1 [Protopterus annectens]|uniref:ORC ubiquitin ligase 1 n=1 Tax=Protopterus annectens TaxID=7888 RepID=UPI001CFBF2A7|nr:ORC ubiquitin ligase 1 [Protopterus annectens]
MAHSSSPNVSLSLTLPITCHVCLGKVRQPVICANCHVFCSICIEVWLKNNEQCPMCRIPITAENPCREVIGGGESESDSYSSPLIRKHLRKARLELLQREYEDEIESLQKEIEDLNSKNLSLEAQLENAFNPFTSSPAKEERKTDGVEGSRVDSERFHEWAEKLKVSRDRYEKAKNEVDSLKEANQKLWEQNSVLVRENLRLKTEAENRSPQKFGRFTMAALQAKIDQSEREMNRLNKALERSDKYIEELESQILQLKGVVNENENASLPKAASHSMGTEENKEGSEEALSWAEVQSKKERIITMRRSLSQMEQPSVGKLQDEEFDYSGISHCHAGDTTEPDYKTNNIFPGHHELLLATASVNNTSLSQPENKHLDNASVHKDETDVQIRLPSPTTPSTSLSFLQLCSPQERDVCISRKSAKKPLVHLRKLAFGEFGCSVIGSKFSLRKNTDKRVSTKELSFTSSEAEFWNPCHIDLFENSDNEPAEHSPTSKSKLTMILSETLQALSDSDINRTRTPSEASMEAAYFDKICELDCMMSESENSKSPNYATKLFDTSSCTATEEVQKEQCQNKAAKKLEYPVKPEEQNDELCSQSSCLTVNSECDSFSMSVSSPCISEKNDINFLSEDPKSDAVMLCSEDSLSEISPKNTHPPSPTFMSSKDQNVPSQCHTSWPGALISENKKIFGSSRNGGSSKRKQPHYIGMGSPSKNSKIDT